jgi:PAS domain S-box-containing protein
MSSAGSGPEVDSLALGVAAAESKAARLEEWLDVLFETSPVAMGIVSTLENRCVRVNQAMADLYGMPIEEILGADPYSMALKITHPEDVVEERKLFAEVTTGARRYYRIEKRYVRPDGSLRWGLLTFSAVGQAEAGSSPGAAIRYVVIQVVDITDRKALAEALARRDGELRHALRVDGIGRLAAGIAHDFNNMLTVIMGHGEVLKRRAGFDSEPSNGHLGGEDLEAILSAAERAASLTAQLLAHGRRGPMVPRTLVLSEAVAALHRLLARTLGSNIQLEQSLVAAGSVFADEGEIGQVVMNLVLNARDALGEGGGRIRVSTEDLGSWVPPGTGAWVALAVSDTGHGMSPEVQAQMFEPFFTTRSDRPGTRGTGLGLATVQRIVTERGGRIDVYSAPGQGTTVTVSLPRVAPKPKEPERPATPRAAVAPTSRRVLVVEDEPTVRSLLGQVLLAASYWVMVARDGAEALRFVEAEREPFHLVVTDLVMAGIGGLALAKRLHELPNPPRVLFVSGYSHHTVAELSEYGNLLPKPFTPTQLLAAVARALEEPPAA